MHFHSDSWLQVAPGSRAGSENEASQIHTDRPHLPSTRFRVVLMLFQRVSVVWRWDRFRETCKGHCDSRATANIARSWLLRVLMRLAITSDSCICPVR